MDNVSRFNIVLGAAKYSPYGQYVLYSDYQYLLGKYESLDDSYDDVQEKSAKFAKQIKNIKEDNSKLAEQVKKFEAAEKIKGEKK